MLNYLKLRVYVIINLYSKSLNRFLKAQELYYKTALLEINQGKKKCHWMWFIFPQIKNLGSSQISLHYSLENLDEARQYLKCDILGTRLIEVSTLLLNLDSNDPISIFGKTDSKKLRSCMTLFYFVSENQIFKNILVKFFNGEFDPLTLEMLKKSNRL